MCLLCNHSHRLKGIEFCKSTLLIDKRDIKPTAGRETERSKSEDEACRIATSLDRHSSTMPVSKFVGIPSKNLAKDNGFRMESSAFLKKIL